MASTKSIHHVKRVPESINLPAEEEKILKFWNDIEAFETFLKQSKGKPRFTLYDGPPFANGSPHYGNILAGTIKDIITRYAHQQGYHVERRFGWDTHGLPVEFEIDKALGIKCPEDVYKIGVDKYNAECRKLVAQQTKQWEDIVCRLGGWIDFKNDYKTLYPWYMESVWYIFKTLYAKGLIYKDNKVMPYSIVCHTPLSNFEVAQNYKDIIDPSVTVTLPLIDLERTALLIWTATPWTLPSNLAACINPTYAYVKIHHFSSGDYYIILAERLDFIFQKEDYEVLNSVAGKSLLGLRYEPIFPYFEHMAKNGAFRVLGDDYVTLDYGTGIIHQAPYFGKDEYRICLGAGIITKDMEPICPVDSIGRFTDQIPDFKNQYVKDADKNIIHYLRATNRLVCSFQFKHSYPFCWRSDTPLIYKVVPSWFVRVRISRSDLLKATADTNWVPEFEKDPRFSLWLTDVYDWAISRNRYWGTPIPLWTSADGKEVRCVGSISELEKLTGQKVKDLHRENIDHLEIPSETPGNPPLKRISEVFDCWFESGAMPFAQHHYPFENVTEFENNFPADVIAEGIDQTRGWFYTLTVISTALFKKAPYKNLVAIGLILANDGQKMSKRKQNYPNAMEIVHKYGADALRLYLISSPVVRTVNCRFKEEGVKDVIKIVFLPWYNAFRFLMQNIEVYQEDRKKPFKCEYENVTSDNTMDCWILSFTQSISIYVRKEMKLYHLYNIIPNIIKYFDLLTNWYIRMNRKRLKGEEGEADCKIALTTLYSVLYNIIRMMAPFAPFITEYMYQHLKKFSNLSAESVHYLMSPLPEKSLIYFGIERAVNRMQSVIELGRVIRDCNILSIKYPLPEIIVVHQNPQYLEDVLSLKDYIISELNVRKITTTTDKSKYGITWRAEPNLKILGFKLRHDLKPVGRAIKRLTDAQINVMKRKGYRIICGHHINFNEVKLIFKYHNTDTDKYEANSDSDVLILMDVTPDASMQDEGAAREIINRIQKLKKKAHLEPTDDITVFYEVDGDLNRIAKEFHSFIEKRIKTSLKPLNTMTALYSLIIEESQTLKNSNLHVVLAAKSEIQLPNVRWVNVHLIGLKSRYCNDAVKGVVLLESDQLTIDLSTFKHEVTKLFGLFGMNFVFTLQNGCLINSTEELLNNSGNTVFIVPKNKKVVLPETDPVPYCKFENTKNGTLLLENPLGNTLKPFLEANTVL